MLGLHLKKYTQLSNVYYYTFYYNIHIICTEYDLTMYKKKVVKTFVLITILFDSYLCRFFL
jgi:hypothetical protein